MDGFTWLENANFCLDEGSESWSETTERLSFNFRLPLGGKVTVFASASEIVFRRLVRSCERGKTESVIWLTFVFNYMNELTVCGQVSKTAVLLKNNKLRFSNVKFC